MWRDSKGTIVLVNKNDKEEWFQLMSLCYDNTKKMIDKFLAVTKEFVSIEVYVIDRINDVSIDKLSDDSVCTEDTKVSLAKVMCPCVTPSALEDISFDKGMLKLGDKVVESYKIVSILGKDIKGNKREFMKSEYTQLMVNTSGSIPIKQFLEYADNHLDSLSVADINKLLH